ncbi:enoyl-CoA hydratase-related protein [uncultured Roseibium sp.]|uniref:enoyl-CoA hydratase-related protein n=1 Tax=uncultured Roseibium sp. TaxID=1936171 RepID=UPI002639A925|nr:enoyl-CoA hydratase-related protein [uncultured Roseibium sp.]
MAESEQSQANGTNPFVKINGRIAEIVLNAPERRNALSLAAWARIPDLTDQIAAAGDIRVCVLKGAGNKCFCAGADISEFEATRATPSAAMHYDEINVAAFKALKSLPIPTVAAIEGPCLGGGLGLALSCDLRIASKSAFFGIPAAKLGLAYPPDALTDLLSAVSTSNAKRIIYTGDRFTSEEALTMCLVDEITEPEDLSGRVETLCATICSNAPLSIAAAKRAIDEISEQSGHIELEQHRLVAQLCIESSDYREGCRAFLEKRKPDFKGS